MRSPLLAATALLVVAPLAAQASLNCSLLSKFKGTKVAFAGVWGYTAPDGREYALVGERTSTWIVDCTDPKNPVEVATISGPSSTWREIVSYKQYVYSVSEHHSGIRVIDMSNPAVPVDKGYVHQADWPNTHSIAVDPDTGRIYANGTSTGQFVLDAAADPLALPILGKNTLAYVHDCYVRRGKAYLAEINQGYLRIANATAFPFTQVSRFQTPGKFTHNAWVTDDDKILITSDENSAGYMKAYDISNPATPVALAGYVNAPAVVHNVFGIGRTAYVAHYGDGFHMTDLGNAATAIKRLAYYDTSTGTSGYTGAWGTFPWTDNGVIYVSDIQQGLYCLQVDAGHLNRYGKGTAGSNGVPRVSFEGGSAMVDSPNFRLELTNLPANGQFAVVFSAGSGNLQWGNVTIHVDLANSVLVGGTANAQGKASLPLPVPNNPGLASGKVYAQVIAIDGSGFVASRGMWFGIAN